MLTGRCHPAHDNHAQVANSRSGTGGCKQTTQHGGSLQPPCCVRTPRRCTSCALDCSRHKGEGRVFVVVQPAQAVQPVAWVLCASRCRHRSTRERVGSAAKPGLSAQAGGQGDRVPAWVGTLGHQGLTAHDDSSLQKGQGATTRQPNKSITAEPAAASTLCSDCSRQAGRGGFGLVGDSCRTSHQAPPDRCLACVHGRGCEQSLLLRFSHQPQHNLGAKGFNQWPPNLNTFGGKGVAGKAAPARSDIHPIAPHKRACDVWGGLGAFWASCRECCPDPSP